LEFNDIEISLCVIYKNEEINLHKFLKNHYGHFDEYIFVDTGSNDNSNKILNEYDIKPYYFEWDDNFSNARNYSISKATKDFIMILDVDEIIEIEDIKRLKNYVSTSQADVFSLNQINFVNEVENFNWFSIYTLKKKYHSVSKGYFLSKIFRFFKNIKGIEYRGHIHENIGDSVRELGLKTKNTDINIYHFGWLNNDNNKQRLIKKREWYKELIRKEFEREKSAKNVFYYLTSIDDIKEKIRISYRYSKMFPNVYQLWLILSLSYLKSGDPIRALKYSEKGLEYNNNNMDLLFVKVKSLNLLKRHKEALQMLDYLLSEDENNPNYLREKILTLRLMNREEEANKIVDKIKSY